MSLNKLFFKYYQNTFQLVVDSKIKPTDAEKFMKRK